MKDKIKKRKLTSKDWNDLASALSGENNNNPELVTSFFSEDTYRTGKKWNGLKSMINKSIDVDKAWNALYSRIRKEETLTGTEKSSGVIKMRGAFLRIAAIALAIVVLGSILFFIFKADLSNREIVITTGNQRINQPVELRDGSRIFLNRNSRLIYTRHFGKKEREVILNGEAFFEIARDTAKPFIIKAGKANVKVLGTSFDVLTENEESKVQVFVKTGTVMLYNNTGSRNIIVEPGYVGTIDSTSTMKKINKDPNYLAWKTGYLVYDGQKLEVVFKDLKKVYNMNIVADDPEIMNETWTIPIYNQSQETIIRLICASFNLAYSKDGDIYHLTRK